MTMTTPTIIWNGAEMKVRSIICTEVCSVRTSEVQRVMRLAAEKRSTSAKEKSWMWRNSASRRLEPKPFAARVACQVENQPAIALMSASRIMMIP